MGGGNPEATPRTAALTRRRRPRFLVAARQAAAGVGRSRIEPGLTPNKLMQPTNANGAVLRSSPSRRLGDKDRKFSRVVCS